MREWSAACRRLRARARRSRSSARPPPADRPRPDHARAAGRARAPRPRPSRSAERCSGLHAEARADLRPEVVRRHQPVGDRRGVGERAPDGLDRVREQLLDPDVEVHRASSRAAAGRSRSCQNASYVAVQSWTARSGSGTQPVDPPAALRPPLDDPGVEEHVQMLGDERIREPRRVDECADRLLASRSTSSSTRRFPSAIAWKASGPAAARDIAGILFKRSLKRQAQEASTGSRAVVPASSSRSGEGSVSRKTVRPASLSSSRVPPITCASSSAIESPRPLPDAREPSPR